jgi:hypothetical protein
LEKNQTTAESTRRQEGHETISFGMRVSVPPDVLIQELEGESVLLNLESERYFGLDDVGTRMWAVLSKSESLQGAYEALLAEYEVDPDLLRRDLLALVERLVENGLVEVGGA